ncbi:MAG: HEAT repeat domain-containing protein [Candidatus Marinimicrobia bacterium]|jgi:hypothetical protein|nr:HEAT repeat domain-containing protein [Candidatus Neomarinimicrobiota bacterium]MBT3618002.1 HEAT repeat domain-containing protein [Candidatus Neomarinimicrobiota bacterium]MBT3828541.1 HEAT repeat domain-containing protein [Candidatus Neomarinimicrobiota bacterium]MBT3997988.1 HEAT repeat domain-containing protein [Candidatus Neomarinimicrobiota bacterium]MBT4280308.1 HEAT repeat domain-containing protein [Candidatus Neomarinimicrobiota bacterium]
MSKLNETLKEKAYFYISDEMSEKDRLEFEKTLGTDKALYQFVEEIASSLNLTKTTFTIRPTHEFLQSQQLILRNTLEQEKSQTNRWAIPDYFMRFANVRQPMWAVAAYVAIAFFIGQLSFNSSIHKVESTSTNYPNILELIETGALKQVNIKEINGAGSIQFGMRTSKIFDISGNPEDDYIQKILLYLLLKDTNPGNRLKAVKYLNDVPQHDTMKMALMSSILSDPNPGVRLRSLKLLNKYKVDDLLSNACLKVLLEDENEAVRMGSLEILAKYPSNNIVPALQVVSMMDENEFIQNRSIEILDSIEEFQIGEKIESLQ